MEYEVDKIDFKENSEEIISLIKNLPLVFPIILDNMNVVSFVYEPKIHDNFDIAIDAYLFLSELNFQMNIIIKERQIQNPIKFFMLEDFTIIMLGDSKNRNENKIETYEIYPVKKDLFNGEFVNFKYFLCDERTSVSYLPKGFFYNDDQLVHVHWGGNQTVAGSKIITDFCNENRIDVFNLTDEDKVLLRMRWENTG